MEPPIPSPGVPAADSWQRVWRDAFPCDTGCSLPYPRVPVSALLETAARRFPGHTACTLFGRPTTYAALDEQARRFAGALASLGAGPGRVPFRGLGPGPRGSRFPRGAGPGCGPGTPAPLPFPPGR